MVTENIKSFFDVVKKPNYTIFRQGPTVSNLQEPKVLLGGTKSPNRGPIIRSQFDRWFPFKNF